MAKADLAVVGDGAGDAEGLQALADGGGSLGGRGDLALLGLLQRDGAAQGVCPLGVLERDGLDAGGDVIGVEATVGAELEGLLEVLDAVLLARLVDLGDAALVAFERDGHVLYLLLSTRSYSWTGNVDSVLWVSSSVRGSMNFTA